MTSTSTAASSAPNDSGQNGYASAMAQHELMLPTHIPDMSHLDRRHHESVLRQRLLDLLDPWGPTEIRYVKNHKLVRRHKVYLNVYHLFKPSTNKRMMRFGFGGAFHSAIECKGVEYAFGGSSDPFQGIYDMKPALWALRGQEMKKIQELKLKSKKERKAEEAKRLAALPPLKERKVIGTWIGSDREWEAILNQLHNEGQWRGPSYRLLSQNCNHFISDLFELLCRNRFFTLAPGVSKDSLDYLYTLTIRTPKILCCCPCIPVSLDAPLPPPPYSGDVFQGVARRLRESPRFPAGTIKLHPRWLSSSGRDILQSPVANDSAGTAFPPGREGRRVPSSPAHSPSPSRRSGGASVSASTSARGGAIQLSSIPRTQSAPAQWGATAGDSRMSRLGGSPVGEGRAGSRAAASPFPFPAASPSPSHSASRSTPLPATPNSWAPASREGGAGVSGIQESPHVADIEEQLFGDFDGEESEDAGSIGSPLLDTSAVAASDVGIELANDEISEA